MRMSQTCASSQSGASSISRRAMGSDASAGVSSRRRHPTTASRNARASAQAKRSMGGARANRGFPKGRRDKVRQLPSARAGSAAASRKRVTSTLRRLRSSAGKVPGSAGVVCKKRARTRCAAAVAPVADCLAPVLGCDQAIAVPPIPCAAKGVPRLPYRPAARATGGPAVVSRVPSACWASKGLQKANVDHGGMPSNL